MYNKYLSLLNEDLEDEAVLASLEDYLINDKEKVKARIVEEYNQIKDLYNETSTH